MPNDDSEQLKLGRADATELRKQRRMNRRRRVEERSYHANDDVMSMGGRHWSATEDEQSDVLGSGIPHIPSDLRLQANVWDMDPVPDTTVGPAGYNSPRRPIICAHAELLVMCNVSECVHTRMFKIVTMKKTQG
jgi:hypothetical protein